MNFKRRAIETGDILNSNARRKGHIESVSAKLLAYYTDLNKKQRKAKGFCRYCHYFNKERIGGSACTTVNCRGCDKDIHFGNTCTDELCLECSIEMKLCKHCAAKID